MSYVSFEWAGTPHASESIKRVDGVEVVRNLVPNPRGVSGKWETNSASDGQNYSPEHDALGIVFAHTGGWRYGMHFVETSGDYTLILQALNPTPSEVVLTPTASGGTQRDYTLVPGLWSNIRHFTNVGNLNVLYAPRYRSTNNPVDEELYYRAFIAEGVYEGDYFDGDTPTYFTPPTFHVRQDGEWRPAPPRVFTGGAYHQVPMKQYSDGGYE